MRNRPQAMSLEYTSLEHAGRNTEPTMEIYHVD